MLVLALLPAAVAGTYQVDAGGLRHPTAAAELIVVGEVGASTTKRDPVTYDEDDVQVGGLISYRYWPVTVLETLKGRPPPVVTLVAGGAYFEGLVAGRLVVLHLVGVPEKPGYWRPTDSQFGIIYKHAASCGDVALSGTEQLLARFPLDKSELAYAAFPSPSQEAITMQPDGRMGVSPMTDYEACSSIRWSDLVSQVKSVVRDLEASPTQDGSAR